MSELSERASERLCLKHIKWELDISMGNCFQMKLSGVKICFELFTISM